MYALITLNDDVATQLHWVERTVNVITFRVSSRRHKMYCGHCVCLSVCLTVRSRIPILLHRPGCNLGEW